MTRIVFTLDDLVAEIGKIDPQVRRVVLELEPSTFQLVAGEMVQRGIPMKPGASEVTIGKLVLRAGNG